MLIAELNDDVLIYLLCGIPDPLDAYVMMLTCRRLYHLRDTPQIWRHFALIAKDIYGLPIPQELLATTGSSARELREVTIRTSYLRQNIMRENPRLVYQTCFDFTRVGNPDTRKEWFQSMQLFRGQWIILRGSHKVYMVHIHANPGCSEHLHSMEVGEIVNLRTMKLGEDPQDTHLAYLAACVRALGESVNFKVYRITFGDNPACRPVVELVRTIKDPYKLAVCGKILLVRASAEDRTYSVYDMQQGAVLGMIPDVKSVVLNDILYSYHFSSAGTAEIFTIKAYHLPKLSSEMLPIMSRTPLKQIGCLNITPSSIWQDLFVIPYFTDIQISTRSNTLTVWMVGQLIDFGHDTNQNIVHSFDVTLSFPGAADGDMQVEFGWGKTESLVYTAIDFSHNNWYSNHSALSLRSLLQDSSPIMLHSRLKTVGKGGLELTPLQMATISMPIPEISRLRDKSSRTFGERDLLLWDDQRGVAIVQTTAGWLLIMGYAPI